MDNVPGRYSSYRYATLCKLKLREFGLVMLHGCNLYRVQDDFVFAWEGNRIIEIHPDDDCILHVPPQGMNNAIVRHWSMISPATEFSYYTRRRATGLSDYDITRYSVQHSRTPAYHKTAELKITTWLRYKLNGDITIDGLPQKSAVKDNAKYRAFNKRLKDLRAVLFAQIKMHAHEVRPKDWKARAALQKEVDTFLRDDFGCENRYEHSNAYVVISRWMETQDPKIARCVAQLAFAACGTKLDGEEGMLRQVNHLLRRAQSHYLQRHCVTILEAIPGSTNDQKSELQSPDGLREVQLPGEAEVPRQDPGTTARTTRWKI